jgi:outer membrane beta-barrel protein
MKTQYIAALILLLGVGTSLAGFADDNKGQKKDKAAGDSSQSPSEKLDVTDLENKYWAPKDTDFSVVQNRTFTKEHKWFVSAQFGPDLTGGNYLAGNDVGATLNYFMSERYGFQAMYMSSFLHPNSAVGDLVSANGFPNFGIMQNYYGVGFNWVPFYSKMSFLGQKILYFDMAITPTIGMTHYQPQMDTGNKGQIAITYGFDVTQYYFFTTHFAFRLDLKNQWWDEKVVRFATDVGKGNVGDPVRTQLDREMIFLLGFTYYFGGR